MRDPWFATEGSHARLPFGAMGARAARAVIAIHERVGYFVRHGGRKVGIPVNGKGLRVEAQLFSPAGHSPLSCRAAFQVEAYLGYVLLRT